MGHQLSLKPQNDVMWNPSSADWLFTLNLQAPSLTAETSLKLAISEKQYNTEKITECHFSLSWYAENVLMQTGQNITDGQITKRKGHYVAANSFI